jgi:hypothetical protein
VHFVWTDSLGNLFYSDSIQVSLDTSILSVSLNQPTCNNEQLGSAVLTFNDSIWSLPLLLNDSLVSGSHLDSLGSGLYIASIVSPNNCSHTVSFSVDTVYRPIHQISWVINEPSCYGSSDGNIEFSFNAPDSIQWTYLDSSIQPDLLPAGQYNILIWNSSCYDTLSVEIFQPDELAINMVIGPDENSGNYSISLEATGGIPPYTYFIDQIEINGDMAFNVMPGPHVIQAMDNHQCTIDSSLYLDFPVSVSPTNSHFYMQNNRLILNRTGLVVIHDCSGRIMGFYGCESEGCEYSLNLPSGIYFAINSSHANPPLRFAIVRE